MDELAYAIRLRMMQDLSREPVRLRDDAARRAVPLRQHGAFLPGAGVGGSGEHWNAQVPRFLPDCFELLSKTTQKYGASALPEIGRASCREREWIWWDAERVRRRC